VPKAPGCGASSPTSHLAGWSSIPAHTPSVVFPVRLIITQISHIQEKSDNVLENVRRRRVTMAPSPVHDRLSARMVTSRWDETMPPTVLVLTERRRRRVSSMRRRGNGAVATTSRRPTGTAGTVSAYVS